MMKEGMACMVDTGRFELLMLGIASGTGGGNEQRMIEDGEAEDGRTHALGEWTCGEMIDKALFFMSLGGGERLVASFF